jgi:hypothetical protein
MLALAWLAAGAGATAQAPAAPAPTLAAAVIDLSHAHQGRYSRHTYSLAARGGKLAVLFSPLPLADDAATIRGAATHLVRFAFDADLAAVTPLSRHIDGVPTLAFPDGDRTYLVMPIRNGRGLVHALTIWMTCRPAAPQPDPTT